MNHISLIKFEEIFPEYVTEKKHVIDIERIECGSSRVLLFFNSPKSSEIKAYEVLQVSLVDYTCSKYHIGKKEEIHISGLQPESDIVLRIKAIFEDPREDDGFSDAILVHTTFHKWKSHGCCGHAKKPQLVQAFGRSLDDIKKNLGYVEPDIISKNQSANDCQDYFLDEMPRASMLSSIRSGMVSGFPPASSSLPDPTLPPMQSSMLSNLNVDHGVMSGGILSSVPPSTVTEVLSPCMCDGESREPCRPGYKPKNLKWKTDWACHVCKLYCTSVRQWKDHCVGKRHQIRCQAYLNRIASINEDVPQETREVLILAPETLAMLEEFDARR